MRASEWEFRCRFWVISAIFFLAFFWYRIDHLDLGVALAGRFVPEPDLDGPSGRCLLQAIFLFAAAIVLVAAWLVPSLVPRMPASGARPRWGQGIVGEAFFWIIALSVLGFAVSLESRVVPITISFGFVVYWILYYAVWKRRARSRQPEH